MNTLKTATDAYSLSLGCTVRLASGTPYQVLTPAHSYGRDLVMVSGREYSVIAKSLK